MKQFPGPSVPLVNMAEELLEAVERLQSRLSENQEPRKVKAGGLQRAGCKLMLVDRIVIGSCPTWRRSLLKVA